MATLTVNVTLGNDSVSNAQLENMAEGTIKGRADGAGTGDPTDLTPDQASTILDAATDPFVRTSNLPSGGGDVVGPASSTDNNVPQWDGSTGKLLKDGLAVSQGGNGAADANKLVQFKSDGGIEAATGLLAGPALYGATGALNQPGVQGYSNNGGEGGRFQSVGGDGVSGSSDSGAALRGTSVTGAGVHVNVTDATNAADLALFHRDDNLGLEVRNNGALDWTTPDGAADTRNNVLPDKTGNAGKLLAVNGGETDYELVAPGITDGSALSIGLQFPNAGLKIADQNADHTLVIVPDENLTADRQLSILVNDANRRIDLAGDLTVSANATVSGTNTGDQDLSGYIQDGDVLTSGLTFPNGGLLLKDTAGGQTLNLAVNEDLTADRSLRVIVGDADRTLQMTGNATIKGTNTGDQTITLTGDVTGSGTGSFAATIANDAVTYAKIQNVSATDRLLGRQSSGSGDVEEITCTAAGRALLDDADAGAQRDTLGIITRKVSTATTGVGASYTDVTDLSFSVVAGTTYHINVWILAECSNTGGGVCLSANGPAFTYFAARYEGSQAGGGSIIRSDVTAYDSLGSLADANSVSAANTPYIFQLQAVLVPSANGTFVARVKRGGGAGNVAVRAGMIVAHAM